MMETPPPDAVPALTQAQALQEEASGLSKVMWSGVLLLAGIAVGGAFALYVFGTVFTTLATIRSPNNETSTQAINVLGPLFRGLSTLLPLTIVIQLAAMAVLTMGFRDLGKVDKDSFSRPSTLMFVMIAGTFVVAAGTILFFRDFSSTIIAATSGNAQSAGALAAFGTIFLDTILIIVGGLLTLVGLIGGQMLGLWRVGSRYNETMLKLGSIFMIIPFLSYVAPILVIVGAHQARSRLLQHR